MQDSDNRKKMDRRELVTLSLSLGVVITAVVYWGIQISGVMDMLEMAYG
ncbi:MAG: hypothetical protein H7A05_10630 [Pseudomonadales bacterium]|nr:hypothetical protein [Pseudomonadales bacterium]MCP5345069.1 hypothetical protein [Pseudomonadales bacterium]